MFLELASQRYSLLNFVEVSVHMDHEVGLGIQRKSLWGRIAKTKRMVSKDGCGDDQADGLVGEMVL